MTALLAFGMVLIIIAVIIMIVLIVSDEDLWR